jgi:hypothetical protein
LQSCKSTSFQYDSQKDVVPLSESKFYCITVVLADDDGNLLHLHLRRADGGSTASVKETTAVDGTMNRNDLELPVKMERIEELDRLIASHRHPRALSLRPTSLWPIHFSRRQRRTAAVCPAENLLKLFLD